MPLPIIGYIGTAFFYVYKGSVCYSVATKSQNLIKEIVKDQTQASTSKVAYASLNTLTALAQGADIVSDIFAPAGTKLAIKVTVTVLDSTRLITDFSCRENRKLSDVTNLTFSTACRVVDITKMYFTINNIAIEDIKIIFDGILTTLVLAQIGADLFSSSESPPVLKVSKEEAINFLHAINVKVARFNKILNSSHFRSLMLKEPDLNAFLVSCKSNPEILQQRSEDLKNKFTFLFELLSITDPFNKDQIKNIPPIPKASEFHHFPFSAVICPHIPICPISQTPIRHVLVVKGTENNPRPVMYDRDFIKLWIVARQIKPPLWPNDKPCNMQNLIESVEIQTKIDNTIQLMIDMINEKILHDRNIIFLQRTESIHNLFLIPELWRQDFYEFLCATDNLPIRNICKLQGVDGVYYESTKIHQWILCNPTTRPNKWPENIPYNINQILDAPEEQEQIDQLLSTLFTESKELIS